MGYHIHRTCLWIYGPGNEINNILFDIRELLYMLCLLVKPHLPTDDRLFIFNHIHINSQNQIINNVKITVYYHSALSVSINFNN